MEGREAVTLAAASTGQQFCCLLPAPWQGLSGPEPPPRVESGVLAPLDGACLKKRSGWWTFTYCVGLNLTQAHPIGVALNIVCRGSPLLITYGYGSAWEGFPSLGGGVRPRGLFARARGGSGAGLKTGQRRRH